jgi:putative Holliday junction resolvase
MAAGPRGKTVDAAANPRFPQVFSRCFEHASVGKALATCCVTYNERTMAIPYRARSPEISATPEKPRRVLAVDYGRKRIGLALSDALGLTAQPLATLDRVNRQNDLRRLREACRTHGVTHIIVGHPLHMTGEAGEMAGEAARFAARLEREIGIQVELVDERLTSWEASQTVRETKSSARRRHKPLDDVAAAVLLRDYLERVRGLARDAAAEKA